MRIFTFLLILLFAFPTILIGNAPDSALMAERDYYFKKYHAVRDTMTVNTWLNLKRLSDNLEQIMQVDQEIINQYKSNSGMDTLIPAKNTEQANELANLELVMERLEARTNNDMRMLWILKTAAGLMVLFILVLLYLFINEKSKLSRLRRVYAFADNLAVEKRKENIMLEAEVEKLKQREKDFRGELEKGLIANQEKLMLLQKKNLQLERELKKLKEQSFSEPSQNKSLHVKREETPNLPDDENEIKVLVQSLSDERNSLMNLASRLQKQLEAEKEKYHEIMQKIKSISGDDLDENTGS